MRAFETLKRVPELFRRFLSQYLANAFEGVDGAIQTCRQSVYVEEGFAARWDQLLPADRLRERQILIQSDIGVYRFEDDTFQDWVRTEASTLWQKPS
jgi:hypothetical protein